MHLVLELQVQGMQKRAPELFILMQTHECFARVKAMDVTCTKIAMLACFAMIKINAKLLQVAAAFLAGET